MKLNLKGYRQENHHVENRITLLSFVYPKLFMPTLPVKAPKRSAGISNHIIPCKFT